MPDETVIFLPNEPGDETNIPTQYPDSGEHWDKLLTNDGDSTYVAKSTAELLRDLYGTNATALGPFQITNVWPNARFKAAYGSGGQGRIIIKTHGEIYEGSLHTTWPDGYSLRGWSMGVNPYTGEEWTWNEIEDLQIGIEIAKLRCTQTYLRVDYILSGYAYWM